MMFYGLKSCDACRRALKALEAAGHAPEVRDVRADGVPAEALAQWLASVGPDTLINRRSTTWRGLTDAERTACATAEGAAVTLAAHPTLMKRPVIVEGETLHVGWTKDAQSALT